MSAFAVSGLVLAIFPICQAAVAQYASTLSDSREEVFNSELSECIRRLRLQQDKLELSLRKLLSPVLKRKDVSDMISSPSLSRWMEPAIQVKLIEQYGESYRKIEIEIGHISEVTKAIAAKLFLGSPNVHHPPMPGTIDTDHCHQMTNDELTLIVERSATGVPRGHIYAQRLKVAWNFHEIRKLFEQLKVAQTRLDILLQKSDKEPVRQADRASENMTSLKLLRKRVMALYVVLSRLSLCEKHSIHCANLRLEYRKASADEPDSSEDRQSLNR